MADIEKVIEKQEEIISYFRTIISPTDFEQKARDVLAALKEQKQRIEALTFDRDVLANEVSYHNCNTCKTPCDYRPQPGERVRANCIGWHGE